MAANGPIKLETNKSRVINCRHQKIILGLLSVATLFSFLSPVIAHAATPLSQSYYSENKLSVGALVSLKTNTTDQVEAATVNNTGNLLGVVVNASNSLLSISSNGDNQVSVTTSGTAQILVSDINGDIKSGDHITASPISGVGMKATSNVRIIGIAQGDLTGAEQTYKDSNGTEQTVIIGQVPALINVAYYFKEQEKTLIPTAIQHIADAIANKSVDTLPIIISAAIFIITLIVVVCIIYSMIRSSIISVGRNPMSQSAIYRDIIQLSALVIAILTVSVIAIYLILTKM